MIYMLSAGEASGDLHASQLISALRNRDPQARFCFLGGDLMAEAAGCAPLIHYRDMAYMGFVDVVRHLPQVRRNLAAATSLLRRVKPDALILVDYPSFNLRLAAEAKKIGIPVFYYISPKAWAWKEWRVKDISRLCNYVLSILPFEPEFYASHGYDRCLYVGNPSVEEIDSRLAAAPSTDDFRQKNSLPAKPIIAIVPGSRVSEIRSNLPVMLDAVRPLTQKYQPVIAAAPGIDPSLYPADINRVEGQTTDLMACATAALVTSGTASLEAALAGVPQIVCYRHSGSRIFYNIMERVLKIPFVSLPNLIAGREVVPELLLHKCTPSAVLHALVNILPDHPGREEQLNGYAAVRYCLGTNPAASTAAAKILAEINLNQ
ncbi:MAG: lipid-A-disaccharide synthase [Muribaculaceae bacterium]|nr:lipid-A-disaccharide synthase [Muribaculaceae bacterium]